MWVLIVMQMILGVAQAEGYFVLLPTGKQTTLAITFPSGPFGEVIIERVCTTWYVNGSYDLAHSTRCVIPTKQTGIMDIWEGVDRDHEWPLVELFRRGHFAPDVLMPIAFDTEACSVAGPCPVREEQP